MLVLLHFFFILYDETFMAIMFGVYTIILLFLLLFIDRNNIESKEFINLGSEWIY